MLVVTNRRKPQPTYELERVALARRRLERKASTLETARLELDKAIRAASSADASLRAIAEVSGLSIEWTRHIAKAT